MALLVGRGHAPLGRVWYRLRHTGRLTSRPRCYSLVTHKSDVYLKMEKSIRLRRLGLTATLLPGCPLEGEPERLGPRDLGDGSCRHAVSAEASRPW